MGIGSRCTFMEIRWLSTRRGLMLVEWTEELACRTTGRKKYTKHEG